MKKNEVKSIKNILPVSAEMLRESAKPINPSVITNKRETRDEARQRIGKALQTEIEEMRKNGLTDILLGLKVYAALVDARYELEQLKTRLAFEIHLNTRFIRRNA